MSNYLVMMCVGACAALGAVMLYAIALLLLALLVRETRIMVQFIRGAYAKRDRAASGDR